VETFLLLLRGINVGGRNKLAMADLRALVTSLGYRDVRTLLQSGNVVCTGAGGAAELTERVAGALEDEFGVSVPLVARTAPEWRALVAANPLVGATDDPKLLHVTFLSGAPDRDRAAALVEEAAPFAPEQLAMSGAEIYLYCPGGYADTPLQNAFLERRLGRTATTRNWRTVTALADLVGTG